MEKLFQYLRSKEGSSGLRTWPPKSDNVKDDLISQETTTQVLETIRSSPIAQTKYPAPRKPIRTSKGQANPDRKKEFSSQKREKSTRRCTSENSEQRSP
ncbi:hypothetical protein CDAR_500461 [Caerostris darwini]|uniref:Uncharacterized protein n=1 Tax=Caerostris darwini TaxID=1538125 RepID=A0AAV4M9B8_9ARAC|nr:hypothetical protein CDAR_500461 [Caerostris darwini]